MKEIRIISAIFCILLTLILLSACIEEHYRATETVLSRFDGNQNLLWTTPIENTGYSTSQSLAPSNRFIETSDQGFFIAGFFFNNSGGNIRILRTDKTGKVLWEKRIPGQTGEIFTLTQRSDGGYSMFTRDGRVYIFDESGTLERITDISDQINRTPGGGSPNIYLRSACTNGSDMIVVGDNAANIWQPIFIGRLSQNGTILTQRSYPKDDIGETSSLIQTKDQGLLIGKYFNTDRPSGGKQILIEKTDTNMSVIWNSTLGTCRFAFCNNDLLGMHESANNQYEIVYQSHEQSNRSKGNMPVDIVYARLDNKGSVIQQDLLTTVSTLPPWVFSQSDISSELINLIPERVQNAIITEKIHGNPTTRFDSLIRTDDGGYVVLGSRYYY